MYTILLALSLNGLVFTFDDGPSPKTTPYILNILKKHNVKAVFCWPSVNLRGKERIAIAKRAIREGHTLCNHSYSHPNFSKISIKRQLYEMKRSMRDYKRILNYRPKFFRPPCGVVTRTMRRYAALHGMKILIWHWRLDSHDWKPRTTSSQMYNHIIKGWLYLRKRGLGGIALFHDYRMKTLKIIEKIIIRVKRGP